MSEFELNLFRQRCREAVQQKARRGELQFRVPAGLCWSDDHIELDPDQRVQQVIRLIFQKIDELGSVRQVFLWLCQQKLQIPVRTLDGKVTWKPPHYSTLLGMFYNPFYAGAYAFGRTKVRTRVVDGQARKTKDNHRRQPEQWPVLIRDHHPGYITWELYDRNRRTLEANAHMKSCSLPKAGRGGRALLAGLLRCRRCGRLLNVYYRGGTPTVTRYICRGWPQYHPECHVAFGGAQAEDLVVEQLLEAVSGNAIEAALQAAERERSKQGEHRRALELRVEQGRYQARLAERRYEAVDPDQRLVAGELEARWNVALERVREAEAECLEFDTRMASVAIPSAELLCSLAQDLPLVWNACTDLRLKQRIVHLVLREILADVDPQRREVTLVLHWAGGRHSEVRWIKRGLRSPEQRRATAREVIRKMARDFSDEQIAFTLNRQRLRTDSGRGWSTEVVAQSRRDQNLPEFGERESGAQALNLQQAAQRLKVSEPTLRRLISKSILPARQVVDSGPWLITPEALDSDPVRRALSRIARRQRPKSTNYFDDRQQHIFSDI